MTFSTLFQNPSKMKYNLISDSFVMLYIGSHTKKEKKKQLFSSKTHEKLDSVELAISLM